jgi:peroxiredoxin
MYMHNAGTRWLTAGLVIAAASVPATAAARYLPDVPGSPAGTPSCELLRVVQHLDTSVCHQPARHRPREKANEKRAAAAVTTSDANAMQAAVVAHGEANSVLSNPYIEQKVTTPESVGVNHTKVPAGGF